MSELLQDVFTIDEVARAAAVPRHAVQALVERGEVRPIPGTRFLSAVDAVLAGRRLRADGGSPASVSPGSDPGGFDVPNAPEPIFSLVASGSGFAERRSSVHAATSSAVHAVLLVAILWWTSGPTETAVPAEAPREPTRMVFLVTPGPGGGGGGGGLRTPLPPRRVERRGPQQSRVTVPRVTPEKVLTTARREEPKPTPAPVPEPKPIEREPEPLPSRVLVAPVAAAAADNRDREGVVETGKPDGESQGAGTGGGAGTGQGTGSGEGLGSGIGDGSGGGTGGGPFRPGSGIEPPRLLREVKAEYTDDARRRGITGDVLLEIVVRRDGSVGDVTILQGLGGGLDQRAVNAVRQWRFAPARRRGEPVDVVVEVAVEFTLR